MRKVGVGVFAPEIKSVLGLDALSMIAGEADDRAFTALLFI